MQPKQRSLEAFLTYKMHRLMKQHDRRMGARYTELSGLSLSEGRALVTIGSAGSLSIQELARRANLDKSQASRGAEGLVQRGLVARVPDEHDGRAVKVTLTAAGKAAYKHAFAEARAYYEGLFSCLSDDEHDTFDRLLDKLLVQSERLG